MTTNGLIVALLALTVTLQSVIMYKQQKNSRQSSTTSQSVRPAKKGSSLDLSGLPVKGNKTARVAVVEFSDYECPFCARYSTTVAPEFDKEFVVTGKVPYVFVNLPLAIHKSAKLLATAAICGGDQLGYWNMHKVLFDRRPTDKTQLFSLMTTLNLNAPKFEECLERSPQPVETIEQDLKKAASLNLSVTPSFAIGRVYDNNQLVIEKFIDGAQPIEVFQQAIKDLM
ncbi:MAG TPA: thioredoxin domain-containing protein [Pyrinomonadaceae bacterium]|nr:thioredoxin domain-containing protein [Pyrinomonadaceae bacterium]